MNEANFVRSKFNERYILQNLTARRVSTFNNSQMTRRDTKSLPILLHNTHAYKIGENAVK
jgi:hypothetical protein